MLGEDRGDAFATVHLPSGTPMKVQVVGLSGADGMASVGLRETLHLDAALETLTEFGSVAVEKLRAVRPTRATIHFKLGFAMEGGKLISMLVGTRGDASLDVTLEWSGPAVEERAADKADEKTGAG